MTGSTPIEPIKGGVLNILFRPTPDINYNFIAGAYSAGTALSLFLFILHHGLTKIYIPEEANIDAGDGDGGESGSESMKEFTEALEGLYLIFLPFAPCLLWSLIVRSNWLKEVKEKKDA